MGGETLLISPSGFLNDGGHLNGLMRPLAQRNNILEKPFSPGHYVTSITYREGLMALPGQGQLIDLR